MRLSTLILLCCLIATTAWAADAGTTPVTKTDAIRDATGSVAAPHDLPLRADEGLSKAEGQLSEGKYVQAIDTLGGVLARRPGDADAETYTGFAWLRLGDLKQAAEHFDLALRYDPRHLGANTYRAELFLEAGDFARAREQLQVVRMICNGTPCGELDRAQAALNAYRMPKADPNAQRQADPNAPVNENR